MFAPEDFEALADIMSTASGKVLMSINDTPEIRRIFEGHRMEEVKDAVMGLSANRARFACLSA